MISEITTRTHIAMKWCNDCGKVFEGIEWEHEPYCKECRGNRS